MTAVELPGEPGSDPTQIIPPTVPTVEPLVSEPLISEAVVSDSVVSESVVASPDTSEPSLRDRLQQQSEERAIARESRWRHHRFSVPYRTVGPKLSLGFLWFVAVIATAVFYPTVCGILIAAIAAIAGLQTADAHFQGQGSVSRDVALSLAAGVAALGGLAGATGGMVYVGLVVLLGVLAALLVGFWAEGADDRGAVVEATQVAVRSAIPPAVAAGCLAALAQAAPGAFVSLVVLVSAYEIGDFLVGTGSANAIEGPVAGVTFLAVVTYAARLLPLEPMTATTLTAFAALTAVCCPLGQILASAVLPHGNNWAPALRRLDSYLIAAPLWLLLL